MHIYVFIKLLFPYKQTISYNLFLIFLCRDLEKQKKKNKLEEIDREYEEEQNSYTDATDLYKTYPELEEMNKLAEDMFYMKLPFVE